MTLGEELKARGLIENASAEVEKILGEPRTVYVGVDPTSDSLHVGHLAWVLLMRRLGAAGHKLIFLVGGGTGFIGDPKEAGERQLLDEATVVRNTKAIKKQLKKLVGGKFELVDNADWLSRARLIPFLRDVGKHFTVNDLMKREVIKRRLDTPDESISYTEFSYALLQGFDYLNLHEKYGADLQIGGSDQWTNVLSGVDLIRKRLGHEVFALSFPLITDSTGKKFGKSEGNAVWLAASKTSPFQFYQFWIRLPDTHIAQYLQTYTFMSLTEIEALMELHKRSPQERQAQETLARVVTEIVHGPEATAAAAAATDALYGGTPFDKLSREAQLVALAEAPSLQVSRREVSTGHSLADVLVAGGLASSRSEARRLIESRGISINDFAVENPDLALGLGDFSGNHALIRKGKKDLLILVLK